MSSIILHSLRRFLSRLRTIPDPSGSLFPLERHNPTKFDFGRLTKGIDNVHVDVRLSPQFVSQSESVIKSLMDQRFGRSLSGERLPGPTYKDWAEFRSRYVRMVEASIHRAKHAGDVSLVQLIQFAAMKFLLQQVRMRLDAMKRDLKSVSTSGGLIADPRALASAERLSWLTRNRSNVQSKMARQLFEQVKMAESGHLADLRKSLLGDPWPVPQEVLCNPLLRADNPFDDEVMVTKYVWLGEGLNDVYSFSGIESLLSRLFRRPDPVDKTEIALANAEQTHGSLVRELDPLRKRRERRHARASGAEIDKYETELVQRLKHAAGERERQQAEHLAESYRWADDPTNVDTLFNHQLYRVELGAARKEKDSERAARLRAQIRYQRRMLRVVEKGFRSEGIIQAIGAAYEMVPLYQEYAPLLRIQQIHKFLCAGRGEKELALKVKEWQASTGCQLTIEPLTLAGERVARLSRHQRQDYVLKFLQDFVTFRCDIGRYLQAQDAMTRIHIQDDPKKIRLSRANRTLYEFLVAGEDVVDKKTIVSHVILKADVRGSTTIVAELRNRGLNPASHFSLHFFDPLTELLATYGANKVFIEGDAVILSFLEHDNAPEHWLSVAGACGLAKRLVRLVQTQNEVCSKNGLPQLELGIGLAFSAESPTFLYDGGRKVMISSAIGKADRLSSCSWLLRKQRSQRGQGYTNVLVCEIPETDPLRGEKGEVHFRYNVNGIELDKAGFVKLQSEITLQRFEVLLPGEERSTILHTGTYPDLNGTMHRLVVREAKVRLFDKEHRDLGQPTADVFYEVVTNPDVLNRVQEAITQDEAVKTTK